MPSLSARIDFLMRCWAGWQIPGIIRQVIGLNLPLRTGYKSVLHAVFQILDIAWIIVR
ncbi:MAG: hypothetical protein SV375_06675 [Thermodesulfobacteriota bacterium]|nr:hypothetical protein [Thermodesulfobacteriota bacterium]